MKRLVQGLESLEKINILLSMTSIKSDVIKTALTRHYVYGWNDEHVIESLSIDSSNFKRADKKLNEYADKFVRLCEIEGLVKKSVK